MKLLRRAEFSIISFAIGAFSATLLFDATIISALIGIAVFTAVNLIGVFISESIRKRREEREKSLYIEQSTAELEEYLSKLINDAVEEEIKTTINNLKL